MHLDFKQKIDEYGEKSQKDHNTFGQIGPGVDTQKGENRVKV